MKKIFILSSIYFFIMTSCFSLGAGVQGSVFPSFNTNENGIKYNGINASVTGTVRLLRIPVVFGFGMELGDNTKHFSFGANGFADWWLIEHQIHNSWNFFMGLGISGRILTDSSWNWTTGANLRIVTGMNYLIYDGYLELYAQNAIAPGFLKQFSSSTLSASPATFNLIIPLEMGMRIHF